jgi:autotransporter-associated beta strand protein
MVAAALIGIGVSTAPRAKAANLYWDANGTTPGTGDSGNWDNSSAFWSTTSAGTDASIIGSFSSADIAYFTGTAGTATLTGPITIGGLVFNGADFTVTGDTLTLAASSGAPTISVTSGNVATLSSIVAGTSGLTKSGAGVLRLTNANNSYTGVTTISAGVLVISSADALGDATSAISILTTNQVPSSTNLYSFDAGSLMLDGSAAGFELARNINFEGRGPLGDRASAILSIGNNTLSGTLTSAVSPLSPVTFRNSRINSVNGTLTLSGSLVSQGTATQTFLNLGGINTAGVGNFNLTGILSGSGSIEKSGGGTLFLNPSSATGFTGTVRVGGSATGAQSSIRVTSTGVFGANTGTNANAAIDMNGGVLELLSSGDLNFNALTGGKNVYLRDNSTFYTGPAAGGDTINGLATFGTFRLAANRTGTFNSRNGYGMAFQAWTPESSNNPNTITNSMGGTLTFADGVWGISDSTARTLTFGGNGNTLVVGSITATGAAHVLTKSGTGLLRVDGVASTFTGATNITAGAIQITDFRSLGTTSAIVLGNATTTAGNLIIGTSATATIAGLTTSLPISLSITTASNSIYAKTRIGILVIWV